MTITQLSKTTINNLAESIKDALVADGEKVASAQLVRSEGNEDEQLVILNLVYDDNTEIEVSFFVYSDGTWFSPYDWHGWQPKHKNEVKDCEWMLGVTGRKAVIFDGTPRMLLGE